MIQDECKCRCSLCGYSCYFFPLRSESLSQAPFACAHVFQIAYCLQVSQYCVVSYLKTTFPSQTNCRLTSCTAVSLRVCVCIATGHGTFSIARCRKAGPFVPMLLFCPAEVNNTADSSAAQYVLYLLLRT